MARKLSKYEQAWRERTGHAAPAAPRHSKTLTDADLERLTAPSPTPKPNAPRR